MEETTKVEAVVEETPTIAEKEEQVLKDAGVKMPEDGVWKVDLTKEKTDAVQEQSTDEVPVRDEPAASEEVQKENTEEQVEKPAQQSEEEESPLELVVDEDPQLQETQQETKTVVQEEVEQPVQNNIELPENIEKLVEFMKNTGGSIEDYVRLNADYSEVDNKSLLYEYYKQKKSHLTRDEIDFLIDDKFSFDEEVDEERDIKRKKLAYKEEIAEAKSFLEGLKDKYYDEVKLNSKLNPDQQKAIDFFNRYNEEQSETKKMQEAQSMHFQNETDKVFNENFKGFDFKVGENKYRFKVGNAQSVKETQSNVLNVLNKYVDSNNMLTDAAGYHKALFAASNADALANHFYEQGKADAISNMTKDAKNINMDPRKTDSGFVDAGGVKVRAIAGDDSSKLKIKLRK